MSSLLPFPSIIQPAPSPVSGIAGAGLLGLSKPLPSPVITAAATPPTPAPAVAPPANTPAPAPAVAPPANTPAPAPAVAPPANTPAVAPVVAPPANGSAGWSPGSGLGNYPAPSAQPALVGEVAQVQAPVADAAQREVSSAELTSQQLRNLLAEDSPYLQQARLLATQQANKAGLLNSSMAAQAGTSAAINAALPIATQDANVHQNVRTQNLANTQQTNLTNAANTLQAGTTNATEANKSAIINATETNAVLKQMLDSQTKLQLADIEAQYKTLMQADDAAMKTYQTSVQNISDILMNPDLTPAAKTAAVANQNQLLKTGLQLLGAMNNLNLDALLVFPAA